MLLAQEFDASEGGQPYHSVNRARIFTPDTRSRLYGYLSTAPLAAPGFRTDGTWVWPEGLADHVRSGGVAPQIQLYEHIRERFFLRPEQVSEDSLWEAAIASAGPVTPDPAPFAEWTFAAIYPEPGAHPSKVLRARTGPDGSTVEQVFNGVAWRASRREELARHGIVDAEARPVSPREAARIVNRLANEVTAFRLAEARESAPTNGLLRLARVFDGQGPSGNPRLSPWRLRLPETERRRRIAAYLRSGRLVVRAAGAAADPLSGSPDPVVPLNFRTDGVWVWQEALAHYLLTRGVAPELDFLCHIEERGLVAVTDVSDEVASAAATLASAAPAAPLTRVPMTYYRDSNSVVCRARNNDHYAADDYRVDRRWGHTGLLSDQFVRGEAYGYEEISEHDAIALIDARLAVADAQPPLD